VVRSEKRERSVLCLHAPFSVHRQGVPLRQGNDESTTCNLRSGEALAQASGTQFYDLDSATQPPINFRFCEWLGGWKVWKRGGAEFAEGNVIAIDFVQPIGILHRSKTDLSEINTRFIPAEQRRNSAAKLLAEQNHCVITRCVVETGESVLWEVALRFERRIQLCGACSNRSRGQTDSATSPKIISCCRCAT